MNTKLIALVVIQGLVGIVSMWVTLKPVEKTVWRVVIFLGVLGLTTASCWLVVSMDREATQQQKGLRTQLEEIKKNTEQPPHVEVNVPPPPRAAKAASLEPDIVSGAYGGTPTSPNSIVPVNAHMFEIGKPVVINFSTVNKGNADAQNLTSYGRIYFVRDGKPPVQQFSREAAVFKGSRGTTLIYGGDKTNWFTGASSEVFTDEMWRDLHNGELTMVVMRTNEYSDPTGRHAVHMCRTLQAPNEVDFTPMFYAIWHECDEFNDRK